MPGIVHLVSVSTGKDSSATACYALATEPHASIRYAFADTGNEHELVYEYLPYMEATLGITINKLRRDFTDWWWHRRNYIAANWHIPDEDWPQGVPATVIDRVVQFFDRGPTGNPYLDLCIIKGRFPSRKAQFCTQHLKTEPLTEFAMELIDQGNAVWSWQGVRADESGSRAHLRGTGGCAKAFEEVGGGLYIYRPIVRWQASDTFDAMATFGLKPNRLYSLGMNRVGCMPCINASKREIRQIAARFPQHINRIEEWEEIVRICSKRSGASFFPAWEATGHITGRNIREVIQWAKTTRGGRQYDLLGAPTPGACASSYGLCDSGED